MFRSKFLVLAEVVVALVSLLPLAAAAKTYKVLHAFNGRNGRLPASGVIFDTSGNLYGTTNSGGAFDGGSVFELVPEGDGNWTEHVLYSFCASANCSDGGEPVGGLVFDSAGNLYGTTGRGGSQDSGAVFQLTPGAGGKWTENVLYNFCTLQNCADGYHPIATLIFDTSGSLYGTTTGGGTKGDGTAFELSPTTNGTWNEKVLHSFCSSAGCADGNWPYGNLIFDSAGNLYGATIEGGMYSKNCPEACGIVFELTPGNNGKWAEQVIHSFQYSDGAAPFAALIFDKSGNLYGATEVGGVHGGGVVFELSPSAKGTWTETVLRSFYARDASPYSNLAFDRKGNLYGTTLEGGHYKDGFLFKLSPNANGAWTETVLHSFNFEQGGEGSSGVSDVAVDSSGNLYGTAAVGGKNNDGVVYEITP